MSRFHLYERNIARERKLAFAFSCMFLILLSSSSVLAQKVGNYGITRATGITYNSISSIGNSVNSWRHNDPAQMLDDNRSFPIPIGFDFWYDGARYTTLSVGINGIADFSSSAATGYTPGDYDSDNPTHNRLSNTASPCAWDCLALMYGDLTTQNQVDPLGSSFMYLTTGVAPNRVFTVEWINLSVWNQINLGTSWNFQLKLHENTGTFEFIYGNMTSGSATLQYKTGINAPTVTAPLSNTTLMIQQVANTTNFLPQVIPGGGYVTTLPTSNSELVFTPVIPANPTNLTFSAVTQTSMTLNWTDNANNEVGYAIYNSLDGINYTYITQLAANTTSYPTAGLFPGTTYYWRVYAVTEGCLSANLDGSQATPAAANFISAQTGNWNTGATWVGGVVPTVNANVTIANTHTVTIDGNITVDNLVVGQGASGILQIGNDANARTINILSNITVNAGAQFIVNAASATSGHILNITGNIINNGTFDLGPSATTRCQTTFNYPGTQTISGTGATTRFYLMTLNMGASYNNVLDITSTNFSTQSTGFLTITNGTFKYESASAITPFAASFTIPLTGGLWVNNAAAVVTTTGGNLSYTGYIEVSAGTLNVGTAADQSLLSNGGDIFIYGGSVNVAGSFNRTNNVTITRFTMSAGTLRVATVGSTNITLAPFMMDVFGSYFNMSGGGIVVVREGGTGANDLGYINTGSIMYTMSSGMLQIGDNTTPAGQTMQINTNKSVFNFTVNSANATAQLVTNSLTVNNDVSITAGTLNANNLNITASGNWTDAGTFTPGTGTVTFTGLAGTTITDATGETFYNLTINKTGTTISLNNNVTVSNAFTITLGTFAVGSSTLTLKGAVSNTGGTLTSLVNGTVFYNQAVAGQTVLAINYGNLTLSAFSKTFPAATVGIASVFTAPNPATAHVMTGNTIDFNGAAAQTVTATTANFIYNNVNLSGGGAKSVSASQTANGNVIHQAGTPVTVAGGVVWHIVGNFTVSGALTNSGTINVGP